MDIDLFISRWTASGGSERANFQQFAIELTQLLGVDAPKPAASDAQNDDYRFERPVTFLHTGSQTRGYVDLYRARHFVMEAKQGVGKGREPEPDQLSLLAEDPVKRQGHGQRGTRRWDDTMLRARNQADGYARAVARSDGWPPFLLIVDVGHVIEVYADFSGQGQGYPKVPDSADFVMYWWEKAALATRAGRTRRFGFITTNSLRQTFNRQVLEPHLSDPKSPLSLTFAIPDHPWVDAGEGAAVRIAMTVAAPGTAPGRLFTVTGEKKGEEDAEGRAVDLSGQIGKIFGDLRIGADVAGSRPLLANDRLSSNGMMLAGQGFIVSRQELPALGLGRRVGLEAYVGPYIKGGELNNTPRGQWVLDFYGLNESEVTNQFPEAYQHLLDRVFPEREVNNDRAFRDKWWVFGRPRTEMRPALSGIDRFIATTETSKHRMFTFLPKGTRPDNMLIAIALDDAASMSSGR